RHGPPERQVAGNLRRRVVGDDERIRPRGIRRDAVLLQFVLPYARRLTGLKIARDQADGPRPSPWWRRELVVHQRDAGERPRAQADHHASPRRRLSTSCSVVSITRPRKAVVTSS